MRVPQFWKETKESDIISSSFHLTDIKKICLNILTTFWLFLYHSNLTLLQGCPKWGPGAKWTVENRAVHTQDSEAGGSGPDGRLDGLTLEEGVVLNVRPLDQQVVLSFTVVPNDVVSGVSCNAQATIT